MHVEASWYITGSVAILESPYMLATTNCQMKLYYHMFGGDCGSLLVYINSGDSVQLVFNRTGDKGDKWLEANITLKSDYAFRVHITASRGTSYRGDIAIDDISFQVSEILFDWPHHSITSSDSKVGTTLLVSIIDFRSERVNLVLGQAVSFLCLILFCFS